MNFAHPLALLLLLLLIPVALLYWRRVPVRHQSVGTGLFWQKALAEEKFRWRWQGLRSKVTLVVQMLIVALLAVAAAGPQIPAAKRFVLIIDNSATMRASDVQPTRMEKAKIVAKLFIEKLRSCDEMALVTVSPAPTEIQPLTSDHELLNAAIDSIQAAPEPAEIEWAVKLAREISTADKIPPQISLITDACSRDATKRAEEGGVKVLRVGTAAGNLAITRFTARRSMAEPAKCEALVEVRNQGNQPAHGSVTLLLDDRPGPSAPFAIVKDGLWQHLFTVDVPAAARLTARIEPGDAYPFDNKAELDLPAGPAVRRWNEVILARGQAEIGPMGLIDPISFSARGRGEPAAADIRVPGDIGSDVSTLALEKPWPPLWIAPAVLAAVLVILEWCLYQRRWTT